MAQVSGGASSGYQTYEAIDLGRRFLAGKSAGLRLTASRRSGGTVVDDENVDTNVFLLGADWRDRVVRLSADVGAQDNRLKQPRTNVTLATGVSAVPRAPDASSNWAQSWSYSNESDVFGTLRAEADIRPAWTTWLALGGRESHEANSLANVTVQDTAGDATTYRFDNRRRDRVRTGDLGLRGAITTGEISHAIVLSAASFLLEKRNAYATSSTAAASLLHTNLYAPVDSDAPALVVFGNHLDSPRLTSRIRLRSVALADTLGFADDTVLLSLGLRRQKFDIQGFAYTTGAAGAPYSKSRTSPVAAVVFKVSPHVSAYANVIESLAQGETAPSTASNFGTQLAPYVAKQKEVGLKFDEGRVGAGVALFRTAKPRSFIDADMVFVAAGQDRHQGFELSMFGEPAVGLKLLAGVTFIDAKQRSTGVAATEGKRVIGVPSAQGNLTVAWGVPGASGLSIDGSIVATGAVRANATNTLTAPAWTREDVGAKVVTRLAGRELVMRLRVDNVANARYWSSAGGYPNLGYLVLASPRTLSVSASIDL